MKPGDLPPIEPLSPDAWSRIEQGVFARLEHEALRRQRTARVRRFASVASAAGALAAAAALALWLRGVSEPESPHAVAAAASAQAAPPTTAVPTSAPSNDVAPAPAPMLARRVASGERLRTTEVAERLGIGDSEVVLGAGSELGVQGSDERGWLLELVRGRVDCHVAARAARPDFVMRAGEVEVRVVGTRFSVEHDAGREPRVSVQEGKVRVSERGQSVLLAAGERWSGFGPKPSGRATSARAKRAAAAERAAASFERATRLESSEPTTALRIYGELSARPGPWAANALYAAGRLELERGNTERARTLLQRYLKRYPQGANLSDAKALLERSAR